MLEWLIELDQQLLLWLNGFHSPWTDGFWWFITKKYNWLPLYLFLVGLIVREFKWESIWVLLGVALTITLADQFASGFCKPFFERFRPSHEPALEGLVHLYRHDDGGFYRGGKFGFISSHAANSIGVAGFLYLVLRKAYPLVWLIFIWAALVAYSRVALGVHYPADILAGGLTGMFWAFLSWKATEFALIKWREIQAGKGGV